MIALINDKNEAIAAETHLQQRKQCNIVRDLFLNENEITAACAHNSRNVSSTFITQRISRNIVTK